MSSDFSVKIGTTNFDGTGSATNLDNGHVVLSDGEEKNFTNDYGATYTDPTLIAVANTWNGDGVKEIKVDAVDINVTTTNFVDIDLNLADSEVGITVDINNSKRGEIDTGTGDDTLDISVQSNKASWSNQFSVNTNEGEDTITFIDSENSHFTQLDIDAGADNDTIDISGLSAYYTDDASARILDGGSGDDTITGSAGNETIFGGEGNDTIDAGAGADIIYAGAGDDTINLTAKDTDIIDGGEGFDALIIGAGVAGPITIDATNIEAVVGNYYQPNFVTMELSGDLIVYLGDGDNPYMDDSLTFTNVDSFELLNDVYPEDIQQQAEALGIDYTELKGYESDQGIVWTDVDLLS